MNFDNQSCFDLYEILWEVHGDVSTLSSVQAIFGTIYFLILFAGVTGNFCVIMAVKRNRSLHTVRNLFIVSLSCSDIAVCLMSGLITPTTAFAKIWLFGQVLCRVVPLIQGMTICISTFTLAAISFDRFILIIYATHQPIQRKQAVCLIFSIWCIAICLSFPVAINQVLEPIAPYCGLFCQESWNSTIAREIYGTTVLIVQFLVPLIVITVCYSCICIKLGKGMLVKPQTNSPSQVSERRQVAVRRRQRTNRMLIAMVVAFVCSWLPQVTFNLTRDYDQLPSFVMKQEYLYGVVVHCLAMSSTCWNPILYAWLNEQLRGGFLQLIPKRWRNENVRNRHQRLLRFGSQDCDRSTACRSPCKGLMNSNNASPLLLKKCYGSHLTPSSTFTPNGTNAVIATPKDDVHYSKINDNSEPEETEDEVYL